MPLQQGSPSSQGRPAGIDNQQYVWRRVRACRRAGLSRVRRCRVCAIWLRVPPLRGRVPDHWFVQGSPQKGVERKDRLHGAQHRPCRVVTGGTVNGCTGQHRLQEGAVTSPCVFGVPLMPLSWLSQSADVSPRGRPGQTFPPSCKFAHEMGGWLQILTSQDNRLATTRSLVSRRRLLK